MPLIFFTTFALIKRHGLLYKVLLPTQPGFHSFDSAVKMHLCGPQPEPHELPPSHRVRTSSFPLPLWESPNSTCNSFKAGP